MLRPLASCLNMSALLSIWTPETNPRFQALLFQKLQVVARASMNVDNPTIICQFQRQAFAKFKSNVQVLHAPPAFFWPHTCTSREFYFSSMFSKYFSLMYTFLTSNFEPVAHVLSSGPTITLYQPFCILPCIQKMIMRLMTLTNHLIFRRSHFKFRQEN